MRLIALGILAAAFLGTRTSAAPQLPMVPLSGGFVLRDDREPNTVHLAATAFERARRALFLHARGKQLLVEIELPFAAGDLEEQARKIFPAADNFLDLRWGKVSASLGRLKAEVKDGDKAWEEVLPLDRSKLARDTLLVEGIMTDGDRAAKLFADLRDSKSDLAIQVTLTYEALTTPKGVRLRIKQDLARKTLLERGEAFGKSFEEKQLEQVARALVEAGAVTLPEGDKAAVDPIMSWLLERRLVVADKSAKAGALGRFTWNKTAIDSIKGEEVTYESSLVFSRSFQTVIVVPVRSLGLADRSFLEK